jgi:hypothetical protein
MHLIRNEAVNFTHVNYLDDETTNTHTDGSYITEITSFTRMRNWGGRS